MPVDATGPTLAEAGPAAPPMAGGSSLGKYRLDRVLGEGGMGVVWAAYDPDLERAVAIKLLRDAGDAALRTRLLREARAMAKLAHPNVVVVYDVGTAGHRDYIAMELVDGGDLTAWLARTPPRADVLAALIAAGRGLAAAHAAGLVHRDFKPHNVLRRTDGRVCVTDFGLARGQLEPAGGAPVLARAAAVDSDLTQTGVLVGTPAYMAPEQFAGDAPDPRSDQFAFCVATWEALAGARPFAGDSLAALRSAVGHGVAGVAADLPAPLRAILTRGLAPDPAARWPDMPALLDALAGAAAPPPRRRMAGLALAAGAVALAIGGTIVAMHHRDDRAAPVGSACAPADEAFGSAHMPALAEVKRVWVAAYDAACALPPSATSHARIACLLEARDEVVGDADGDDDAAAVGALTAVVAACEHE